MDTTVPSVKSLLVRARISLAEAAEARKLSCEEVRLELGEVAEGLVKLSAPARRHVRDCERCRAFRKQLQGQQPRARRDPPVGPLLLLKKLVLAKLGITASAGSAHVAGGAGATVGAGAAAAAGSRARDGGAGIAGGILTAGAGALATKAVAGLAAAAIVTAGVAAADHTATYHHHHRSAAYARVDAGSNRPDGRRGTPPARQLHEQRSNRRHRPPPRPPQPPGQAKPRSSPRQRLPPHPPSQRPSSRRGVQAHRQPR